VRFKRLLLSSVLLLAASALCQTSSPAHFDGKTWWDYVKVLADDNMDGRDTGSAGLQRAEAYIVDQLKQSGLEPAGVDGFYQEVKFRSRRIVEKDSSLALVRDGKVEPLVIGEDAMLSSRVDLAPKVEAPLVFVGWGLKIPEQNYDDLSGLDLKGKVVVVIGGSPAAIPGPLASHYQSTPERWKAFRAAGAIGIVYVLNPATIEIPWSRMTLTRNRPNMSLADPKFNDNEGVQLAVTYNPAHAEQLFAGSGHTFAEIAALAKDRKPLPHFPLAVSIKATAKMEQSTLESSNVIAKLPGSDPELKNEYVVLSAHIDHLGIGEPINGDRIYNGAFDNASGSALLLDVAANLKKSGEKLKRSLLFVFVTGEEKGLLGSRYFTAYPTVDRNAMVADINVDMFLPIVPLKRLTVWGLDESTLGATVRQIAEAHGVVVQNDPQPEHNVFIRSDQYNFIRHGIPALMMGIAPDPNSPEQQQLFKDWFTNRYHAPSDDLAQPVDLAAAAGYEEIVRSLMIALADNPERPQWNENSFFKRYAGNPSQN
jgi:Zn-dependent M28 family amino/carboxypeptidase